MAALFRPGCRIIVKDAALPGIYSPEDTLRCAQAVIRAADEITPTEEVPPFRIVSVLCLRYTDMDEQEVCHRMLTAYDGVVQVSTVTADGQRRLTYTSASTSN